MDTNLTLEDVNLILESLNYKKQAIVDQQSFSYESKQKRIEEVEKLILKIQNLKKEWI